MFLISFVRGFHQSPFITNRDKKIDFVYLNGCNQIEVINRDNKVNSYCMESGFVLRWYTSQKNDFAFAVLQLSTYDVIKVLCNPKSEYQGSRTVFSLREVTYRQFGVPLSHHALLPNLDHVTRRVRGSHTTVMLCLNFPSYLSTSSSSPMSINI